MYALRCEMPRSDDSSSSESSSASDGSAGERKKRRRSQASPSPSSERPNRSERERKKEKRKRRRQEKKERKRKRERDTRARRKDKEDHLSAPAKREASGDGPARATGSAAVGPAVLSPGLLATPARRPAGPMTQGEAAAADARLERRYEAETGRWRLVRGGGEIVEEIVSRQRQGEIIAKASAMPLYGGRC